MISNDPRVPENFAALAQETEMCRHFTLNYTDILPNLFIRFQSDARIFRYPLDEALNAYPYIYGPAVLLHAL